MKDINEKVRLVLLLDFYSNMLSEVQQQVICDYAENDLSLSEIAAERNISRQAVSDIVNKSQAKLEALEAKLGIAKRFLNAKQKLTNLATALPQAKLQIQKIIDEL